MNSHPIANFLKENSKSIRWGIAVICLIYIGYYFYSHRTDFENLYAITPKFLLGIAVLFLTGHCIYAYRFGLVIKEHSGQHIPFRTIFRTVTINRFLGTFAPQSGNVYQSLFFKKNYNISLTHFIGTIFAINWFDTCLNLLLALGVITIMQPDLKIAEILAHYLLGGLFVLIFLVPIILELILSRMTFENRLLKWIHRRLADLFSALLKSMKNPGYVIRLSVSGIISFLNTVTLLYFCFCAIGVTVNWPAVAFFQVIVKLFNRIMITPGNLGVREIAYGVILGQMDQSMAGGMTISVIMRCVGLITICLLGILFGGHTLLFNKPKENSSSTTK